MNRVSELLEQHRSEALDAYFDRLFDTYGIQFPEHYGNCAPDDPEPDEEDDDAT